MKFAIRDDDLNWFYTPECIQKNLEYIWDICPVSMSSIPFIKGNWKKNVRLLEKVGPKGVTEVIQDQIIADDVIYPIGDNIELVNYVKNKINENKIHITIHGINHRNSDPILPKLKNNFSIGAEFFTSQNLTDELGNAVSYLEKVFEQKINVFTPPQNLISEKGYLALETVGLNICGYFPSPREIGIYNNYFGLRSLFVTANHKLKTRGQRMPFPHAQKLKKIAMIEHCALQPGSNINQIKSAIEYVKSRGGDFVLSTHSYAFEQKMQNTNKTMGEALLEVLEYVSKDKEVDFVTLDKLFK